MQRLPQILLIVSFLALSWLAFMIVHEIGHIVAAWTTGGTIALVVLHPLRISSTILASNPHPLVVAWGGAIWGTALPLVLLGLGRIVRSPGLYLLQFFAGFCLVANGIYLAADSFERAGDGATLLAHGASQWQLLLFGVTTVPMGFWLWHGQGPHFGLGEAEGKVDPTTASVVALLLITVLPVELALSPA